ncbi:MAG: SLC45 family MFS transporter [Actinobacteria bacterium]|nr:SLC45 family MFS transporter [Actinomycetota bacterium]
MRRLSFGPSGPLLFLLGTGALGLAWSLTTTATYLPGILNQFTDSTTVIALVLAAEGIFAITLPLVIGPWSDGFQTPMGRRRPFMMVAIGPMVFSIALLAYMPNLWTTALLVSAFFFAYYVYEPPYRGLYPDLVPETMYGRSQSVQHLFRGVAIGGGLMGGLYLFHLYEPAPFLAAAVVLGISCLVPVLWVKEPQGDNRVFEGVGVYLRHSFRIMRREPEVRRFLIANTAWEGAFAGARSFVLLYVTVGLGQSVYVLNVVLGAVAVGYLVAALIAGPLGDRYGLSRVILGASIVYGVGMLGAGLGQRWHFWYVPIIFLVSIAAGAVMTLAWGLLFKLMPEHDRGAVSGLATTTKGVGLIIGPVLAGGVIDLLRPHLETTKGYQALWPVLGVPILLAIPLVATLWRAEQARDAALAAEPAR